MISNVVKESLVIDPDVCVKISGIAAEQTLQLARKKYMAKGCFDVQKQRFCREISAVLSEVDQDDVDTIEE